MAEVERKRPGWFSRLTFGTAALIIAGLLLLSYLSVFVNPAKAWFFTIFGLLFIPLVVLTTLFFIWALVRRSRMTGFLFLMLLPAIFLIERHAVVFRMSHGKNTPAVPRHAEHDPRFVRLRQHDQIVAGVNLRCGCLRKA